MANLDPKFRVWKPTPVCYLRRALLSESFAWAVQNGLGALFAMLFLVVDPMTFTLACVTICLYAAASQVMSLDRTVGGRLFAAALFVGCIAIAGVLGGGLASLAWLARGDAEGLFQRVPAFNQLSRQEQTQFQEWLPNQLMTPLPSFVIDLFKTVAAQAATLEHSFFPMPDDAFWVLLMVLFIIAVLPFSVARADEDHGGLLVSIPTLFLGMSIIFGAMLPTMGLQIYWTEAVVGFIYAALITAGSMTIAALLLFSISSHDEVREQLGRLLQGAGALVGHAGSVIAGTVAEGKDGMPKPRSAAVLGITDEKSIKEMMERDARALAAGLMPAAAADVIIAKINDEEALPSAPFPEAVLQLRARAEKVQSALGSAKFEPPLWGITSQPGSNLGHYAALLATTQRLVSAIGALESCAPDAQLELAVSTTAAGRAMQTALALCSASVAASCADISVALRHMPLGGPCSGPQLPWRPRPAEYWQDLAAAVQRAADALQPDTNDPATEGAIAESVYVTGRSALIAAACCEVVLHETQAMEAAAAVALAVTSPPPPKQPLTFKEKISSNPYAQSFLTLLIMGLGAPAALAFVKGTISFFRGTVAFCRSSKDRAGLLRDRSVQFAFKYWLGMSVAMVAIILILWKGEGSGAATPMEDLKNLDYFFTVWQPLYAWIAISICAQQYVEASAFKGLLRAVLTAISGTLGYAAMLNGSLAQNPYFMVGMVVAFHTVCSLFSGVRSLRYSLFLATNTFSSVMSCQYVGCCDIAGDPKVYGGKVLSTIIGVAYAMMITWCFLPYYTSERMLGEEAGALAAGMAVVRRQVPQTEEEGYKDEGWKVMMEDGLKAPLGRVRKDLNTNIIESHRPVIKWTVIPPPRIVAPLAASLSRMADILAGADSVFKAPNLWSGSPGPAQKAMMDALKPQIDALLSAADATVAACCDCMKATAWNDVRATRNEASRTLDELWTTKAALRAEFIRWNSEKQRPAWTLPDLRFLAWKHIVSLALREVEVCAVLLAEGEAAMDRDGYFAWLPALCGRRPA